MQFDWDEPTKAVRLVIDQNKARVLGFTSQDIAAFLNNAVSGVKVTSYREGDKQIEVVAARRGRRARGVVIAQGSRDPVEERQGGSDHADRGDPPRARGGHRLAPQPAADHHRARRPDGDAQGPDVTRRINPLLDAVRAQPPLGYRIEIGGAIEDSTRGQKSIAAGVPLLVVTVLTLLMVQLKASRERRWSC